jgi:predicted Zn-dependent protease
MRNVFRGFAFFAAGAIVYAQAPAAPPATQLPPVPGAAAAAAPAAVPAGGPTQAEIQDMQKIQAMQVTSVADLDARLKLLDEFIVKYPNSTLKGDVFTMAGDSAQRKSDSAKAKFYYEEAIKADPSQDYAMIMLGAEIARTTGENDIGKTDKLNRATKLVNDGMSLIEKRPKPANVPDADFQKMQKDDLASGHLALGFIAMANKQDVEAGNEFVKSVDLAANGDAMNLLRAGMAYNNGKQFDQANAALNRFLAIPGIPDQYKKMAEDEKKRGDQLRNQKK